LYKMLLLNTRVMETGTRAQLSVQSIVEEIVDWRLFRYIVRTIIK